ncbi:hypothetical protein D3C75_584000 [compost metagenome]
MIAQCVQDLIHLEYRRQRFNQQRRFDGAARKGEMIFGKTEYFTPPGRFLPGLGFRQVEIGAASFCQQSIHVVEEVERKIKQAARDRLITPGHVFFRQVKTTDATNQHRWVWLQLVYFAGFVGPANGAVDGIAQVDLPIDNFAPTGCERIFKVSHKHFDVSIQRVNHHLAFDRPCDLDPSIQ